MLIVSLHPSSQSTAGLTLTALCAFAANSVFCRLALATDSIDPASFTGLRLLSGAATLLVLLWLTSAKTQKSEPLPGSWRSALALFTYAITFSYAYLSLETGTGALILFACVQLSMLIFGLIRGETYRGAEWLGLALAFAGFVYLVLPGVTAPDPMGALLMGCAGLAWAVYTVRGAGSATPLRDTTGNFVRTVPMLLVLLVPLLSTSHVTVQGIVMALGSGILASAIGYAIWYTALPRLSTSVAAVSQLSVPVLAALAGLVWLQEWPDSRLIIAALCILGGIATVVKARTR